MASVKSAPRPRIHVTESGTHQVCARELLISPAGRAAIRRILAATGSQPENAAAGTSTRRNK